MTELNLYRCSPRQARSHIIDCLYAGLTPFLKSSPGMGKSAIYHSVAEELNLVMIDHRLSTSDPTDLSGLPGFKDGKARFMPFDELFPIAGTPLPKDKDGWLIFLDEINAAKREMQAASYKLVLDNMTGQHALHENVVIGAAGNLETDRAIVNPLSTAMQSRMVHIEMELNHPEFMEDVALKKGWDSRIIAFLNMYPSYLMDFQPTHQNATFCCPRTWEFMNRLVKGKEVTNSKLVLYAGTITSGVAVNFVEFCAVFATLITVRDIVAAPKTCPVPQDQATKWATICHMMEKLDEKNIEELATYADRFPLTFRVLFYRSLLVRHPKFRQHEAFTRSMGDLASYLFH